MSRRTLIVDANIAVKMLHDESDSQHAVQFFTDCAREDARILVPEHFLYELTNVCQRLAIDLKSVLGFYNALNGTILTVVTPQESMWLLAEKIALDEHPKSGFPTIYDCIYHAMAIEAGGTFVTADSRHVSKASRWGHVMTLADFRLEPN